MIEFEFKNQMNTLEKYFLIPKISLKYHQTMPLKNMFQYPLEQLKMNLQKVLEEKIP